MAFTESAPPDRIHLDDASDPRFLTTFDQAAVGIGHIALDGRCLRLNRKFCEFLGYTQDELMRKTFQEFTHPDDLAEDLKLLEKLTAGEIPTYTLEKRYIRKDKSLFWAELTVSMVRPPDREPYFISIVVDIGGRKAAAESLHREHETLEHERKFAALEREAFFNLSRDCLAVSSPEGYYIRVNPAFCELLSYTERELTARPLRDFVHPDDRVKVQVFRECLLRGEVFDRDYFECRFVARDGSIKWLAWNCTNIFGIGNYISGRDITARKAEEADAKQRHVVTTTNSKLNAIGLMASNMAHEINNPLTIIYGEACILRKMVDNGDQDQKKLSRIASNVMKMSERIVSIVNGLRTLSRDGSKDPMKPVPLRQIFEDTIPFCRGKIAADNIELNVEEIVNDVYVCCRHVQLSQALLNLLNNAYDAVVDLPERGRIDVFTRQTEARVEICVRDNGHGVNPEIRANLFQPFVSSKAVGKGMGLGLSISRSMIEANGGELFLAEATSRTTFVISLPRVTCE